MEKKLNELLKTKGLGNKELKSILAFFKESSLENLDQAWQDFLKSEHSMCSHKLWLLYQCLDVLWPKDKGPLPVWVPDDMEVLGTHIEQLKRDWSCSSRQDLFEDVRRDPEKTWNYMAKQLGIVFDQAYEKTVEFDKTGKVSAWFTGAKLNIFNSCFQVDENKTAILCKREGGELQQISYGKLRQRSMRVAAGLKALGYQSGDAIAIDMSMNDDAVCIYLGIVAAGMAVVSIADSFSAQEIKTRLRISQAKAIFTQVDVLRGGKVLALYEKVIKADAPQVIVLGETEYLREGDVSWKSFLVAEELDHAVSLKPDEVSNILFSSGTTGEPKAIPWSHTTPIKCAADAWVHHNILEGDVLAWPTNLGWMMGPWLIYASLVNGATMALYEGIPSGEAFGDFVEEAGVSMLGVIPSMVKSWKDSACMEACDWSKIKCFSSTGECSKPEDMFYLMQLAGNKPVLEYCGGTEIGGGYVSSTLDQPSVPSTFNSIVFGLDLVLVQDGQEAEEGEVFIKTPSIGLSIYLLNRNHDEVYYSDTPSIDSKFPLRRHGDQLKRLAGGYYQARGRVDDTMNLGGIKTSSAEIEAICESLDEVEDLAAVAQSPENGGPEQLVMVMSPIVPKALEKEILDKMQKKIRECLNPLFKIHRLVSVEKLPRTASNKIMRRVLRDQLEGNQL